MAIRSSRTAGSLLRCLQQFGDSFALQNWRGLPALQINYLTNKRCQGPRLTARRPTRTPAGRRPRSLETELRATPPLLDSTMRHQPPRPCRQPTLAISTAGCYFLFFLYHSKPRCFHRLRATLVSPLPVSPHHPASAWSLPRPLLLADYSLRTCRGISRLPLLSRTDIHILALVESPPGSSPP